MRPLERRLAVLGRRLREELDALLENEIWPYLSDDQLASVAGGNFSSVSALPAGHRAIELADIIDRIGYEIA